MRACSLFLGPVLDQQHPGVAAHLRDKPTCAHTSRPGPSTAEELIEDASGRHITVVAVIARPQTACASQLARRSMPAEPHRSSVFPLPSVAGGHRHRGSVCRPDRAPSRRPLPGLLPPSLARAGNLARQRYDRVVLVAARRSSSLHANKGALSARKGDGPCPERNRTAEPGPRARAGQVFGGAAVPVMSAGPLQIRSDPRLLDIFRIGHSLTGMGCPISRSLLTSTLTVTRTG